VTKTQFFSIIALLQGKKRNTIKSLSNDNGGRVEGNDNLAPFIRDYFAIMFTSDVYSTDDSVLGKVHVRVTLAMNGMLLAPYTIEKVKNHCLGLRI
jgi:hypothetical protein